MKRPWRVMVRFPDEVEPQIWSTHSTEPLANKRRKMIDRIFVKGTEVYVVNRDTEKGSTDNVGPMA